MSGHLADTKDLSRGYCPGCEPRADPVREILRVDYCGDHCPDRRGLDDARAIEAMPTGLSSATIQEGGIDGKAWCDMLHRGAAA